MVQATSPVPARPSMPLTPEDLEGDLVQPGHPLFGIVWANRQRMSGTPCFAGTRVPVQSLFDHLEGGPVGFECVELVCSSSVAHVRLARATGDNTRNQ